MKQGGTWILPGLFWVLIFTIIPLIYTLYLSITDNSVIQDAAFVGFENYQRLLSDSLFWSSLWVSFLYVIISLFLTLIIGTFTGWLFSYDLPGIAFLRRLFTIPLFLAPVAVGSMATILFNPNFGLFGSILSLASRSQAPLIVILLDSWRWTPLVFMVVVLAIQSIPEEAYDNARLDASSDWSIFRYVTLPRIVPALITIMLLRVLESWQLFDIIRQATAGGPATSSSNLIFTIYRNAFQTFRMGYASAIGVCALLPTLIVAILFTWRLHQHLAMVRQTKKKVG